ncbi:MAG TPA: hypothetical protein VEV82_05195 [Actinomycetota bacterium]|nr:hypothetical protein [Actinomycetota bacterium]
MKKQPTAPEPATRRPPLSRQKLDAIVAEATVDSYNDDEQLTGLSTLIEEHLALPFSTEVLGVSVSVKRVELTDDGIVALCVAGRHRQRIPILDLPLPARPPRGAEWIEAYRHWSRGRF